MSWKKQEGTKHTVNCTMAFGNLSAVGVCERCDELRNGATPRSWNVRPNNHYYDGGISKPCTHNNGEHKMNPGGYCIHCGAGRCFS